VRAAVLVRSGVGFCFFSALSALSALCCVLGTQATPLNHLPHLRATTTSLCSLSFLFKENQLRKKNALSKTTLPALFPPPGGCTRALFELGSCACPGPSIRRRVRYDHRMSRPNAAQTPDRHQGKQGDCVRTRRPRIQTNQRWGIWSKWAKGVQVRIHSKNFERGECIVLWFFPALPG
jgi:hypothetical protein